MNKFDEIRKLLMQADKLLLGYSVVAQTVAMVISELINEVTGLDVRWDLGREEAGINTICFYCKGRGVLDVREKDGMVSLCEVLSDLFAGLVCVKVDTPYGVYLTKEEAGRIREALGLKEKGEE